MENETSLGLARRAWYPIFLSVLFIGCFSLAVFLGVRVGLRFVDQNGSNGGAAEPPAELVTRIALVDGEGTYLKVKDSASFAPEAGRDWLLMVWVKFRRLPQSGSAVSFVGKTQPKEARRPGYSLSLAREGNVVRPVMYLQPPDGGNVGWLPFSEVRIMPQRWVLFALSLKGGRYLGLHTAVALDNSPPSVELAGGYEIANPHPPTSSAELLLGAFGSSTFRGEIGPIGVFAPKEIEGDVKKLLREAVKTPLEPPAAIDEDDIRLWVSNISDPEEASRVELVKPDAGR